MGKQRSWLIPLPSDCSYGCSMPGETLQGLHSFFQALTLSKAYIFLGVTQNLNNRTRKKNSPCQSRIIFLHSSSSFLFLGNVCSLVTDLLPNPWRIFFLWQFLIFLLQVWDAWAGAGNGWCSLGSLPLPALLFEMLPIKRSGMPWADLQ